MADIDFNGGKGFNVGDAKYNTDAVNLRTLLRVVELSGGGASSITGTVISVSQGTNILTGGTAAKPSISVTTTPTFSTLYSTTLSGGTIFSAGTNLYSIFTNIGQRTFVQEGSNVYTGGTDYRPSIHIADSPSFNNIRASGTTYGNVVSGNTYYSGSTLLSSILTTMITGITSGITTFLRPTFVAFGNSLSAITGTTGLTFSGGTLKVTGSTVIMNGTALNSGAVQDVFKQKNGVNLEFRGLSGVNMTVTTSSNDDIIIQSTATRTTSGSLSLDYAFTDYIFNGGGSGGTWTLPVLMNNIKFNIVNIGSGAITLNSNTGGNDIFDMGGAGVVNSISIAANEGYLILGNGTYWIARKLGI